MGWQPWRQLARPARRTGRPEVGIGAHPPGHGSLQDRQQKRWRQGCQQLQVMLCCWWVAGVGWVETSSAHACSCSEQAL
jgi:hypothetical protein